MDEEPHAVIRWVFLDGDRITLTAGVTAAVLLLTRALVSGGVLAVGPESAANHVRERRRLRPGCLR